MRRRPPIKGARSIRSSTKGWGIFAQFLDALGLCSWRDEWAPPPHAKKLCCEARFMASRGAPLGFRRDSHPGKLGRRSTCTGI